MALISATLYLVAYWTQFNVNIFQFVSLNDLVATALIPLGWIVGTLVIYGLFFGPVLASPELQASPLVIQPDVHDGLPFRWKQIPVSTRVKLGLLGGAFVLAWIAQMATFDGWGNIPYGVAIIVAGVLGYHARNVQLVAKHVPNPVVRPVLIAAVSAVPTLAFASGMVESRAVLFGDGDFMYVCERDLKNPRSDRARYELRFVGKAGEAYLFVQDPSFLDVRVLRHDEFQRLILRHSSETLREIRWKIDDKEKRSRRSVCDDAD